MTTQRDRRTTERWHDWAATASLFVRGKDHRNHMAALKSIHTERLGRLLDAGVKMRSIRRMNYDTPMAGVMTFEQIFKLACENRDQCVGRRSGIKRTKEQLDHARTQRNRT